MAVLELTNANFKNTISNKDKPTLVDFYAPWCGHCKMQTPVLEKVAAEYSDKVIFGKLNTDDSGEIAAEYGVQSIPTLIIFKGNEILKRVEGMRNENALKEMIKEYL